MVSHETHPDRADPVVLVAALRAALVRYELSGSAATLDEGFAAAAALIAMLRPQERLEPANAEEARWLMSQLPDFEQLVTVAVGAAERSAQAAARDLWRWFGLSSVPPAWEAAERSGARVLVACACVPLEARGAGWLRPRLLRLAAQRWATLLVAELCASDDEPWRRALGARYESVHTRYAPRTRWRTRQLSQLLESDQRTVLALRDRLTRWLAEGGDLRALAAELEAAFVLTRAPDHLA